jgi:hypothetical protein
MHAAGIFTVTIAPLAMDEKTADSSLGRMSIDKQFQSALEATSKGEMLTAGTSVKGSAGYVAVERVTGTLEGRRGSFTLQHTVTLTPGAPQLSITVVPDSGTGDLIGLTDAMTTTIADGKHSYNFAYMLSDAD